MKRTSRYTQPLRIAIFVVLCGSVLSTVHFLRTSANRIGSVGSEEDELTPTDVAYKTDPMDAPDETDISGEYEIRPKAFPPADILARIREDPSNYRFQWSDFITIPGTPEEVIRRVFEEESRKEFTAYEDFFDYYPHDSTYKRPVAAFRAALYLNFSMPAPQQIILLPEYLENGFKGRPQRFLVRHVDGNRDHKQFGESSYRDIAGRTEDEGQFQSRNVETLMIKNLSVHSFMWNPAAEIAKLPLEVQDAYKEIADHETHKHFNELSVVNDAGGIGTHMDWRFFKSMLRVDRRPLTIQSIVRAWSLFAEVYNIDYWWAHGSTIGWYWNGLNLPYDVDTDLQVPIKTLSRLAQHFNGSLVVQHPSLGNRSYYLDVSPYYLNRKDMRGENVIDARFIDVHTGAYIDITGLANTTETADAKLEATCKNGHITRHDVISPLRLTQYEGIRAYVPFKVEEMLTKEYRFVFRPSYRTFEYNRNLRLWVPRKAFCPVGKELEAEQCYPTKIVGPDECDPDWGTCDLLAREEFLTTSNFTSWHEQEQSLWDNVKNLNFTMFPELLDPLVQHLKVKFPLMHRRWNDTFN